MNDMPLVQEIRISVVWESENYNLSALPVLLLYMAEDRCSIRDVEQVTSLSQDLIVNTVKEQCCFVMLDNEVLCLTDEGREVVLLQRLVRWLTDPENCFFVELTSGNVIQILEKRELIVPPSDYDIPALDQKIVDLDGFVTSREGNSIWKEHIKVLPEKIGSVYFRKVSA